jgi:uncharacterized repeat protein (TIGR01451 family)
MLALLAAGGLVSLCGCFGVSQNPSYFPRLLPTGDIIRTHAKPPGWGYFTNFDPHACRLEVRPLDATNPVRTSHVLIATVYDGGGQPRRNRRVEWMVEGVGNVVEVDESGYFPGRGYKVDNKYAVSYTDYCEHTITRGTDNPNDDFVIRPGQTWCVVSSAVEGDTHVTAYAPEIANWQAHKVVVTKHWVDAEWVMPPPAANRAGTEHSFVTNVFRHTDKQPLANYRVRYRILDGPPAMFIPSRTQEAVAISDLSGNAGVTLVQLSPQPGINRISVEIVRPPDPTAPSGSGIIIGRGETTKEWLAPMIALNKTGPAAAAVGQEIPYTINVINTGKVETQAVTVRDAIPEGTQYVRSEPPAVVEGNQLAWTLAPLAPGQSHNVQVVFSSSRVGAVTNSAIAITVDGLRAENAATTQITQPQLTVSKVGPAAGMVGVPINYQITVSNPGSGPATNVVLSDDFDQGLEHESRANPVELRIGTVGPNETKTIPLTLTPRQMGQLMNRVTVTADGGLRAQAQHSVNVQQARLSVSMIGPGRRYVDKPAVFDIRVSNSSDVPLTNVVVRNQLAPELAFVSATEGGQPAADGQIVWNVGTLQARQERTLQVTARCLRIARQAISVAIATADPALQERAEVPIEILGLPAFRLEVFDTPDAIEVNGKTSYRINVTNQGTLPGAAIEITAQAPPQLRVVDARGPSQAKVEEAKADGQRIVFSPVEALAPGQTLSYTVEVQAQQAGSVRFRVELKASTLERPVVEEESTTIFAPGNGPGATPGPAAPNPGPAPAGPQPPPPNPPGSGAPAGPMGTS